MDVSGPNGYSSDISSNIELVGTRNFRGSDSYTATTEVISDGMAGDVYQCNVTSVASRTGSVTLCGNLDTGTVFVIMSIAHAQSIFMPINVRALCTVIILSCHMLDPAVSSLVNGLVYVKWRRVRDLSETRNGKSWPSPRVQR